MIAFKDDIFTKLQYRTVDYDTHSIFVPTQKTGNVAQSVALKFNGHEEGVIVGNTHLYWRPQSFYERLRQGCIYIQSVHDSLVAAREAHQNIDWSYVLAGGKNIYPLPAMYLAWRSHSVFRSEYNTNRSYLSFINRKSIDSHTGGMAGVVATRNFRR